MIVVRHKSSKLNEASVQGLYKIWIKADGTAVDMELVKTVLEAVIQDLGVNYPSVEYVIKHKDILFTDDPRIQTMATDGVSIFINPAFAEYLINMDEDEGGLYFEFVLIHEALHVLFDHCYKHSMSSDRFSDDEKVNMAQDYEINFIIENFLKEGVNYAPFKGVTDKIKGCYNEEFGKKGLTWEEIYDKVPKIERKVVKRPTSDEFKDGFKDGFDEILADLKKQKLVEHYEIRR